MEYLSLDQIHLRDPYILPYDGTYYLYGSRGAETWGLGTGLDVCRSNDLIRWSVPQVVFSKPENFWADRNFWAPEVHIYRDRFYMLVSFKSPERCRGTQILVADTPTGPFLPLADLPVTPASWECLDGTLWVENGTPYLVFCHEWVQACDGEMCAIPLSDDLTCAIGEPVVLFRGSEPAWADQDADRYITDGPFLYRAADGRLFMLWSSVAGGEYCESVSVSDDGTLFGHWIHEEKPLFSANGGHGMLFHTFDGQLCLTLHQPNNNPLERPHIFPVSEIAGGTLRLAEGN